MGAVGDRSGDHVKDLMRGDSGDRACEDRVGVGFAADAGREITANQVALHFGEGKDVAIGDAAFGEASFVSGQRRLDSVGGIRRAGAVKAENENFSEFRGLIHADLSPRNGKADGRDDARELGLHFRKELRIGSSIEGVVDSELGCGDVRNGAGDSTTCNGKDS